MTTYPVSINIKGCINERVIRNKTERKGTRVDSGKKTRDFLSKIINSRPHQRSNTEQNFTEIKHR